MTVFLNHLLLCKWRGWLRAGWHVCNNARSCPGTQMVKPPRLPGNTLLRRVLLPGREGVTQLLRGGQALLYMDHLNICVTLQNLQSTSNLLTEHNMSHTHGPRLLRITELHRTSLQIT